MSHLDNFTKFVTENAAKAEERTQKLIALTVDHQNKLALIIKAIPGMKQEALARIDSRICELIDSISGNIYAVLNPEQQAKFSGEIDALVTDKHAAVAAKVTTELTEKNRAAVAEIQANTQQLLAQLTATVEKVAADRARIVSLDEIAPKLRKLAAEATALAAKNFLDSEQLKENITGVVDERLKPALTQFAAQNSAGNLLLNAYKGVWEQGAQAKAGDLFTYYGNTLLCLEDNNSEPKVDSATGKSMYWAMIAAAGRPGIAVATTTTTTGGTFSGQTGSYDLSSGADSGSVSFASAFSSTPVVTASILMPDASGAVIAVGIHTVSTSGFSFALSGPTPDASHKLKYVAI